MSKSDVHIILIENGTKEIVNDESSINFIIDTSIFTIYAVILMMTLDN